MSLKKYFLIIGACLIVSACTSNKKGNDSSSKEERAALNLQMGVRYLEMGMLNVAKEKLEKANELDSNNVDVHNALAVFNERIEQNETAEYHYQQAMILSSDDARIKNNYGRFLCETNKIEDGIALLNQAIALPLNNRKWFAMTNLGLCYLKQGRQQDAELAFRSALQTNPNYAPALAEMQKFSYQNRKYMSARAFLERYLAVAIHSAETLWIAIQTERVLGNKKLTEQYQQQLMQLFPASKQAQQVRTSKNR